MPETEKQIYIDSAMADKMNRDNSRTLHLGQQSKSSRPAAGWVEDRKEAPDSDIKYLKAVIRNDMALKNHKFYIIHCNYFCRTDRMFIPAELALSEFSLKDGITRTYHTLVDPGYLPLGYAYEAKRISSEIHGLPTPPYKEGEHDFKKIFSDISSFLECSKENEGDYAPLFAVENNIPVVEDVLSKLTSFGNREKESFNVYPIYNMFFWLKNKCVEQSETSGCKFPVVTNAITEIDKDVFRYCSGISCHFHNSSEDKYHNCSLSIVQRLAYVVCDHCCRHVGVELIPGKHIHSSSLVVRRSEAAPRKFWDDSSEATSVFSQSEMSDFDGLSSCASSVMEDSSSRRNFSKKEDNLSEKSFNRRKGSESISGRREAFGGVSDEEELDFTVGFGRGRRLENVVKAVGLAPR